MAPKAGATAEATAAKPKANTKAKLAKADPAPASRASARQKAAPKPEPKVEEPPAPKQKAAPKVKAAPKAKALPKTNGAGVVKKTAAPKKEPAQKTTTSKKAAATTKAAATKAEKAPAKASATTKKTTASKSKIEDAPAAPKPSRKRKADDDEPAAAPVKKVKLATKGPVINEAPTQRLKVFVFGEGSGGELGLGTAKNAMDVKRPRLNQQLSSAGIVQLAAGGMHAVALTNDNKVLTWGVNDGGALGRDTNWEGGLKDMDNNEDDDDSDDEDNGLNPKESTPGEVDWSGTNLAENTKFVEVAAGDSLSLALTDDGKVYGWGQFRSNEGVLGFLDGIEMAQRPVQIPGLKDVVSIRAGANHALALTNKGLVYAWGSGQQNQLGRRIVDRTKAQGNLHPQTFGLPKGAKKSIKSIETGHYHSFALANNGDVYAWGLNNFCNTGIPEGAGDDAAAIQAPEIVSALSGKKIVDIKGGAHHSIAATADGDCLVWGRIDGQQLGISDTDIEKLPDADVLSGDDGKRRVVLAPTKVTAINGPVAKVSASTEHNIAITREGKAWSWGFSANYQTGLGTDEAVAVATLIDNNAIREQKINGAYAGGQYGMLTAPADVEMANGA